MNHQMVDSHVLLPLLFCKLLKKATFVTSNYAIAKFSTKYLWTNETSQ